MSVPVAIGVAVGVDVGSGVSVGVRIGVEVKVEKGVSVRVGKGVGLAVSVAVTARVGVGAMAVKVDIMIGNTAVSATGSKRGGGVSITSGTTDQSQKVRLMHAFPLTVE